MSTYLDHNATSPLRPAAKEPCARLWTWRQCLLGASLKAALARKLLDDARETIAREIGVIAPMISFTSGGTEANNLAIKSAPVERLLISAIEHPAVIEAAKAAHKPAEFIPVTPQGIVDLEALAKLLEGPKALGQRHARQQ